MKNRELTQVEEIFGGYPIPVNSKQDESARRFWEAEAKKTQEQKGLESQEATEYIAECDSTDS